ncbi:hypothetical protein LG634_29580 [Streptomyces bambusae]|uniref:hypothetical protein n=1 Tax=Streptomyces bambusae TaxID=1550616 RepID=UPI001CFEC989|nr:hypothetical protein [Streptomyces bambusae]MCB5168955.1 hypothetical protein [Streptomyces bambusae]
MSMALIGTITRTDEPRVALRRVLGVDAVVTAGNGVGYAVFSGAVGRELGVGRGVLLGIGVFLVVFGAGVGWLASRQRPPAGGVTFVVEANTAWVVASLVALGAWVSPTVAGAVWIVAQAAVVAGFALVQWLALRSMSR